MIVSGNLLINKLWVEIVRTKDIRASNYNISKFPKEIYLLLK